MNKASILIIDDEADILDSIGMALKENYICYFASNAREAMALLRSTTPSLILLDIYMPGEDGVSLCKGLRESPITKDIPIVMMTAMNSTDTRIAAFESGADDFLAKPFHLAELHARLQSKLRRHSEKKTVPHAALTFGNVSLDPANLRAYVAGAEIALGTIEFRLLTKLASHTGELVLRDDLINAIWGEDQPVTRALDTHVGKLRAKLANSSVTLRTVYGRGFLLVDLPGHSLGDEKET